MRPPQTDEGNAPATVVMGTRDMGEEGAFTPVWRIDDGPVHGIGWDICQAIIERSQVRHPCPASIALLPVVRHVCGACVDANALSCQLCCRCPVT